MSKFQPISASSLVSADRIFLYGVEGIGKTSWPAKAAKPLYLDLENRASHIRLADGSAPEVIPGPRCENPMVKNWSDVLALMEDFPTGYKTFIIDTLDELESMLHAHIFEECGETSIENVGGGFQKGYEMAVTQFRPLLLALERMRNRHGVEIIILAHAGTENVKNPAAGDFFKFAPKVHKKLGALVREWCDTVLYATFDQDIHVKRSEAKKENEINLKGKATGTGERVLKCTPLPAWYAKNHYGLPQEIELDYAVYDKLRMEWKKKNGAAKPAGVKKIAQKIADSASADVGQKVESKVTWGDVADNIESIIEDGMDQEELKLKIKGVFNKLLASKKYTGKTIMEKFYPGGRKLDDLEVAELTRVLKESTEELAKIA